MKVLGIALLSSLSLCCQLAGQTFTDDFNRLNLGNGWYVWGNHNVSLVSGELRTYGEWGEGGGIVRSLAVSFPLSFLFDFRTLNVTDDFQPSLPYNDGGWFIDRKSVV